MSLPELRRQEAINIYTLAQIGQVLDQCWPDPPERRDYERWLRGYLRNGGKAPHYFNRPWDRWEWVRSKTHLILRPLYGSYALNIIIPEGGTVSGERGHSNLFFMTDFTVQGRVSTFSDIELGEESALP
jgi:hypothetical protein